MADRNAPASFTIEEFRVEFNELAVDVGDISTLTSPIKGTAVTDLTESVNQLIASINNAPTFSSESLIFEGTSPDDFETTLSATNPTADNAITLPDASGEIVLDTATQTLTNKTLTSPIINSPVMSGVSFTNIDFEGSTVDDYETQLIAVDPTQDNTLQLPNASDILVGRNTTDTLTNKSIDLTNNTLSGTLSEFNTALSDDDFVSLTGTETLTNKTLTNPEIDGVIEFQRSGGTLNVTGSYYTIADDATQSLGSDGGKFEIMVEGEELISADVFFDGTSENVITVSSDIANADTDTKLCIYTSGGNLTIKNRLGSSKNVIVYSKLT